MSPLEKAVKNYTYISGYEAHKPVLDDKGRLFIYLTTSDNTLVVGVLRNKKENFVIKDIYENITHSPKEKAIAWYGKKITNVDEIINGVDYEVFIISYYHPQSERYRYIQVNWTKRTRETLEEIDLKRIFPILFDQVKKFL